MPKKQTPSWLVPAILVTGVVAFWAKAASAAPAKQPSSAVQTATVGGRVYSITRLGQGGYLVALLSTNGQIENMPVNYAFNQGGALGEFGDTDKLAQLKADLNSMNVSFT